MPETTTPNMGLIKPEIGGNADTWGNRLNDNFDVIDLKTVRITDQWKVTPGDDTVGSAAGHFIISRYDNSGLIQFPDPVTIDRQTGDIAFGGSFSGINNLTMTGTMTVTGGVNVTADIYAGGNINAGISLIATDVIASGTVTGSSISSTGNSSIGGGLTVTGNIAGADIIGNSINSLGDVTVGGTVFADALIINPSSSPITNIRLAFAADPFYANGVGMVELYPGSVATGFQPSTTGLIVRHRYVQAFTTTWFTVGLA